MGEVVHEQFYKFGPSVMQRLALIGGGLLVGATCLVGAMRESPIWLVFVIPCSVLVAEGIRMKVCFLPDSNAVCIVRAIRTTRVEGSDIRNVRVPPWGPVLLTLKGPQVRRGANWAGQVNTGLRVPHKGTNTIAHQLADLLGVPFVTVWPALRRPQDMDET
jgi:hypothetical protein